jgi:sulfate adenylyltransferase subunit 2
MSAVPPYQLSDLDALEAESVFIVREVAAEFERPVVLFSGGKDSAAMLHVAVKAFRPGAVPFPVLHVDTGHNFPEVIRYRDEYVASLGLRLLVASVEESIRGGRLRVTDPLASRNRFQTTTLLDAIAAHRFDAVLGGGRRDEEKARAKERVFSFRDDVGHWDPRNQRPELWNLYNGRRGANEHMRVFPLSNWTELDIWRYLARERVPLPPLYFAHRRRVVRRDGMLMGVGEFLRATDDEDVFEALVRYRTVGDMTCTAAIESAADTYEAVVAEVAATRITERGATRADDRFSDTAMEDRKREGYF